MHLIEFFYLVNGLGEKRGKLLIIENFEVTAWRDFADSGGVPSVPSAQPVSLVGENFTTKQNLSLFCSGLYKIYLRPLVYL